MYTVTLLDGQTIQFDDTESYMDFLHRVVAGQLEQMGIAMDAMQEAGDVDPIFLKALGACQTAMVGISLMQTKKSISFVEQDGMQGFTVKEKEE